MKAHMHLLRAALADGLVVSVNDGGDWPVRRSRNLREILVAINSVCESTIVLRDGPGMTGRVVGVAWLCLALDDNETVVNTSVTPWMEAWWNTFSADNKAGA